MIVIKRTDGGVSIMRLVDGDVNAEVEKWKLIHPGEYVSHREMPDDASPGDRTFRNAWADETPEPVIDIDMSKASGIWRDKLRAQRAPLLQELDAKYMKAIESGNQAEMARVAARKQILRDAPQDQRISAATTADELKDIELP
jgi:hypothetical protein